MVFGGSGARRKTIELCNSNEVITQTQGTNHQSRRQEGSTQGAKWQLEDAAQWELLFQGEEVFWKTVGAIRAAGYDSIYSLIQDANEKHSPTPLLTREGPGSRGTRHLRLLIPKRITGISERDRATLQAWLELVDWTGLGVLPKSQVPRRMKLNMDPMSQMFQWLRKEERQKGIKDSETAHLFTDNRK